ncbi:MAG TPA: hypothetical protein DCR55_02690 [Lentisphaeria bacterium]|nr:hypothetical protein [Lentisphaeria bacterium]
MIPTQSLSITLVQLDAGEDMERNLESARCGVRKAAEAGSKLVIFPENVLYRGTRCGVRKTAQTAAEYRQLLAPLAREFKTVCVWGGIALRDGDQVYNALVAFDERGELICEYRKIHLFQLLDTDSPVDERKTFAAGTQPAEFSVAGWRIGAGICYDLRFPELYRCYAGAHLMLCPASFTAFTGKAHWQVLARARAIENQCFFAAVNQCGTHEALGVETYGHSLVADPWGLVLEELDAAPGEMHCVLEPSALTRARATVPALNSIQQGRLSPG